MKPIKIISLKFWLPILVTIIFLILLLIMIFNARSSLDAELIDNSIQFIDYDLNSLTRELEKELQNGNIDEAARALSNRGLNIEYKVLVMLDDNGEIIFSTRKNLIGHLAETTLPFFDTKLYINVLIKHQTQTRVSNDGRIITVYSPITLERHLDELRPSNIGALFLVYDIGEAKDLIWEGVWQTIKLPLAMAFLSIIFLYSFLKHFVSKPLDQLTLNAKKIEKGELGIENKFTGRGEILELGNAFNNMSYQLKKNNEILNHTKQRYEEIIWSTNVGTWEWNVQTGETIINDLWADNLGYTLDELTPFKIDAWLNMVHPDDLIESKKLLKKNFSHELDFYEYEIRMRHKNGKWIWILDRGKVVEWTEDDKPLRLSGTHTVITQRKQVEEKLRSSEEKYRAMFEASTVGMALNKMDGTLVEFNQAYLDIIGYTKEEALQLTYWDVTPEKYEENEQVQLQSLKENHCYGPYEKEYIQKNGNYIPVLLNGVIVKGTNNEEYVWSIIQDISERKDAEEQLKYQASHDSLTGLVNRHEFERRIVRLISTIKKKNEEHALCFMDLDQFKIVNDACGHAAGDELLRQLTSVLQNIVRIRDTLARLGGDEFAVLMEHCSLDDAHRVAKSLQNAVQDYRFVWEEHTFKIGVSIGLVPITEMTSSVSDLLKDADAACYVAKEKGRNRIHVYHTGDTELAQRHGEMQWVEKINLALEEDRFCLYAQDIVSLIGSEDKHYELLIRMIDEQGQIVMPNIFMPSAERYNLIFKIDCWVIKKAFSLLSENPQFLKQINFISINLSGQSLAENDFQIFVIKKIMDLKIPPEKICFEITETAAISNLNAASEFISKMKVLGCQFALDDFGSGLSSFAYLKNLPVNYLKIDGMFVKDIENDPIDHAMVTSINDIGHVMGMKTIAEFVENDEIKGMLKEIGVDYAQGYGIDKPRPIEELIFGRSSNVINFRSLD